MFVTGQLLVAIDFCSQSSKKSLKYQQKKYIHAGLEQLDEPSLDVYFIIGISKSKSILSESISEKIPFLESIVFWFSTLGPDPVMDGSDRTVLWFMSRSVMYCARQYKAMSGVKQQWSPVSVWVMNFHHVQTA